MLGNRATARSDQAIDLENRSDTIGYREDIRADRVDLRNGTGNRTAEEQQIAGYRSDIQKDRQDFNATHQDIRESAESNSAARRSRTTDSRSAMTAEMAGRPDLVGGACRVRPIFRDNCEFFRN